jgi:hypothetical protein
LLVEGRSANGYSRRKRKYQQYSKKWKLERNLDSATTYSLRFAREGHMTTRRLLSAYGAGHWTRKDSTDSITDIRLPNRRHLQLPNRRHLQLACCCSNLSASRSLFLQKLRLASATGHLDQFYRRPQILRRMNRCPTSWRLDPHVSKMRENEPKKSENSENWTTPLS